MSQARSLTQVRTDLDGRIAILALAAPPANALSAELAEDFGRAVREVRETEARAVVIESSIADYFAVGADLKLVSSFDADGFDRYLTSVTDAFDALAALAIPSVASISGYAVGGGLELALACSFRIASSTSRCGLPEIKLGLLPGAGGTQRLPRLVGRAAALDLLLSGRSLTAAEAHRIGLIDDVVPAVELADAALAMAAGLAELPREAVAAILRCVEAAVPGIEDGLAVEAREIRALFGTGDAREGIAAFLERRGARFT